MKKSPGEIIKNRIKFIILGVYGFMMYPVIFFQVLCVEAKAKKAK